MSEKQPLSYNLKIVLLGDGFVGKTSLRRNFMGLKFETEYLETLGADFAIKASVYRDKAIFRYQIWDLAGQPRFGNLRKGFYLGAQAALVLFSIADPKTKDSVLVWTEEFWKNSGKTKPIPVVIIGNKSDLRDTTDRPVSQAEGLRLAEDLTKRVSFKIPYIETSAKTGDSINLAFDTLTEMFISYYNIKFG